MAAFFRGVIFHKFLSRLDVFCRFYGIILIDDAAFRTADEGPAGGSDRTRQFNLSAVDRPFNTLLFLTNRHSIGLGN